MNTKKRKDTLMLIMADMKHDAATLDGQPFNGQVTANAFGRLMIAIAALADVAASSEEEITHLKEALVKLKEDGTLKHEPEEVEMGCFCDLEPGERPDKCVLEMFHTRSCVYAHARKKTGECVYWRPVSEWEDKQAES